MGGEVTNDSKKSWLVSGGSNSKEEDFFWLGPGKNSDDVKEISDQLDGDVDAVWPAGKKLKDYYSGNIKTSGAFKLSDLRYTNIDEDENDQPQIWDYTQYFTDSTLPQGWALPDKYK